MLRFLSDFRLFIRRRVFFFFFFSEVFLFLSQSWASRVSISSYFSDWSDEVLGFGRLYPVHTVGFRDGLESLFILAYLR